MLKYAKVINEETKMCAVGFEDPNKIYSEEIIPEEYHMEVVKPAEYDEDGNLISPEVREKVVDKPEEVIVTTYRQYYESRGMTEIEIEQAYNGQWYVAGHCPEPEES